MKTHTLVRQSFKRYNFACRDAMTGALKPVPQNGSRKKFCRRCPALKQHGICLFGYETARRKMKQLGRTKHANADFEGMCKRCNKQLAEFGRVNCSGCLESRRSASATHRENHDQKVLCAFPGGCQKLVGTLHNKSKMCLLHARQMQAQKQRDERQARRLAAPMPVIA